ncbi:MAG: biosynthetic-type acetolactate synthase large subunit [Deltaproteobacteria bacterium]|nr:biosynthetic-type acetolactate synthase large subunit [Deltaproteobacteria bacterium]MBW2306290.1 biosynthetic-type acetolactate synthase large subunit [Deltaproteobacteria bacterium]
MSEKKTGARILLECLVEEGVDAIFGFPGGAVLDIFDCLGESRFKFILTRHEQGAVHAADGYARVSGKTGVCIVTSGPGATNTVTGIATACMDSIPLVIITGQVPTLLIGNDAFQEADIVGITRPCTKHNYLVKNIEDLHSTVKEAFYVARTGRPGPILVDVPKDVQRVTLSTDSHGKARARKYRLQVRPHAGQIRRAMEAIRKSNRPVVYAGGGIITSGASRDLIQFCESLSLPITLTLMGLGGFPGTHPLFLGMLGMHGTFPANMAVTECDCLIALGARFDDRVTGNVAEFAPKAKIIQVDIDPSSISKNVPVDIPIVGDVGDVLRRWNRMLDEKDRQKTASLCKEWTEQIDAWKRSHQLSYKVNNKGTIKPQFVVEKLYELTRGNAIISTEVGQNQMWTAQFYRFDHPRTILTSGGLGTMGYGFPAAIGAQVAAPDRTVIDIAGDGSIQMNIQELATAVQHQLPVKVAILNNGFLGMVRQWQELFYGKRYSHTEMPQLPDYVKLAEAYNAVGLRATTVKEVEPVIRKALAEPGPVIMDFLVEQEEGVYPMVPAGASIREMLLL